MRTILHNAQIINEGLSRRGWVLICADRIEAVGEGPAPRELLEAGDTEARDLQGHWLLPGVIDSHVHFREPGMEHKACIASESRAAAAGGVTSVMEMPNTNPATTTIAAWQDKRERAAKDSVVNYAFYIGATNSNLEELRRADYTKIPGIKLFMGSSTGGMLVDGDDALSGIFQSGQLIMVHCEDEQTIRENLARAQSERPGAELPVSLHPLIRSAEACYRSTAHALALARKYDARLHVAHLTTAEELELFNPADEKITAEVCVAHLLFTADDYKQLGSLIKCNPAVKEARHRQALRKALCEGRIATVSTDHAPHTLEEKMRNTIKAPSGMPMVQFSLPAMLSLAAEGEWTPELVIEKMAHNQARLFGIEGRGFIRPGYYADLVEVDPDGTTTVTPEIIKSKCGWSPLAGRTLRTKVLSTWVNGRQVYSASEPECFHPGAAQPLRFRR